MTFIKSVDSIIFQLHISSHNLYIGALDTLCTFIRGGRAFAGCMGSPGFDYRSSQTKDFKLVVEAPLPNDRYIKDSSTQKLVDPLPE